MKRAPGTDTCFCLAARRYARQLTRQYDRHLAPLSITCSQFSILAIIEDKPGISIAELSEEMVMERTTLVRAINPLRNRGLLNSRNEGPRSAIRLSLSNEGKSLFQEACEYWEHAQQEEIEHMGSENAVSIRQSLLNSIKCR